MSDDIHTKLANNAYATHLPWINPKRRKANPDDREAHLVYVADQNRLDAEFKADALDHVGLTGHPKAEQVWAMAWDRGHSHGKYEVLDHLEDLASLVL